MKTKDKNITIFEEHLEKQYGKPGSVKRTKFENKAKDTLSRQDLLKETHPKQKKP